MVKVQKNHWGYTPQEMARFLGKAPPLEIPPRFIRMKEDSFVRKVSVEEFEKIFSIEYLTHLRFPNEKTFKKVMRQKPWFSSYTDLGKERSWLGAWYAKERESGQVAPVSVRYINEKFGYGLFAEKFFPPYSFIGYYTGNIVQWSMFKQNQNGYCFQYPSGLLHWRIFMIDAMNGGNETRFVNHSDSPNAEPVTALNRGLLHVFFRTTKKIEYGEEITISYGKDYWMRREKLKREKLKRETEEKIE